MPSKKQKYDPGVRLGDEFLLDGEPVTIVGETARSWIAAPPHWKHRLLPPGVGTKVPKRDPFSVLTKVS